MASRKTAFSQNLCTGRKTRKTRTLLNLHWLFCLRISAKSWTTFCRDRIAPNCTIRHPVRPIVALQRRTRFSARFAGFCRIRCHQRRARRAERASFSAFVSNPDFRVPRLRPNRRTGADLAVRPPRRSPPSDPESRPGLSRRSWPSTFWSRCSPGLLDVHLSPGLDPGSRSSPESVASRFWTLFPRAYRGPRIAGRNARAKSTLDRLFTEHRRKRGHPRGPESRPGLPRRSWPSTFWSRWAWPPICLCPYLPPIRPQSGSGNA